MEKIQILTRLGHSFQNLVNDPSGRSRKFATIAISHLGLRDFDITVDSVAKVYANLIPVEPTPYHI